MNRETLSVGPKFTERNARLLVRRALLQVQTLLRISRQMARGQRVTDAASSSKINQVGSKSGIIPGLTIRLVYQRGKSEDGHAIPIISGIYPASVECILRYAELLRAIRCEPGAK